MLDEFRVAVPVLSSFRGPFGVASLSPRPFDVYAILSWLCVGFVSVVIR